MLYIHAYSKEFRDTISRSFPIVSAGLHIIIRGLNIFFFFFFCGRETIIGHLVLDNHTFFIE